MRTTLGRIVLLLTATTFVGCSKLDPAIVSKIEDLGVQNVELNRKIEVLDDENDQLSKRLAAIETELSSVKGLRSSLEANWKQFEAGYSPETLHVLNQNSETASTLLAELKTANDVAHESVASLQKVAGEIGQLKEQCQALAKEAAEANPIGPIKGELSSLKSENSRASSKMNMVESKIRSLESDVRSLRSKVRW